MGARRMSDEKVEGSSLVEGLYDRLVSGSLDGLLTRLGDGRTGIVGEVEESEAPAAVAQYLEHLLVDALRRTRGKDAAARRLRVVQRVIDAIGAELGDDEVRGLDLGDPLRRLLAVHAGGGGLRPDTDLGRSALLTGSRQTPSLASQLGKEFAQADRVDILCSFIKWSGLRLLLDGLRVLTETVHPDGGPRLRVITTSYMGATDPRAIEALRELPNTEVKVSYDTKRTRLHAKAYLIQRETGFGSAYVGSANISHAAMSEGLEWTNKISQYELPYLWRNVVGTFETYWNDEAFEPYTAGSADRLSSAIDRERNVGQGGGGIVAGFDVTPYPFQEEVLEALQAGREIRGRVRQLVVAATGTGKTVIAAFDYRRWAEAQGSARPPLLFIAHRREILHQALATFRGVLRDQNFGDVLEGGAEPSQTEHLFCTIQSYQSRGLAALPADRYRYVVVDEFHHAEAASYRGLLEHVTPDALLALTATPERGDGFDVARYFEGGQAAEIRLPDAIDRKLLCPFQYFGVSDSEDLSGLTWQRGGYKVTDLDRIYTGNDARAGLVLDKANEVLLDPLLARGLGFCVSVAHAEFMAAFFTHRGVPSVALSGETPRDERRDARGRLERREINFIFTVDLFNEGVDIPVVDAVLLLRPTESLTIYLQQLGRGLRLHPDKECLTVLDFIAAHDSKFSFANRFRAMSSRPEGNLEREIQAGFPHMPAGCAIRLERVAQERVLANVTRSLIVRKAAIARELKDLGAMTGRVPLLGEALDYLGLEPWQLFKHGTLSEHLRRAGLVEDVDVPDGVQLAKGMARVSHVDDPMQLRFVDEYLTGAAAWNGRVAETRAAMLHGSLWGQGGVDLGLAEADAKLRANPSAVEDLKQLSRWCLEKTRTRGTVSQVPGTEALALHAHYTRDEVFIALGHWSMDSRPAMREGVLHLSEPKLDVFFVTLNKSEENYSPTTMYDDYVVSDRLFHWQSQSTTSAASPTGQRYINHRDQGYTPVLFVREYGKQSGGLAAPYAFLGALDYVSHTGDRPISITWRLRTPMPARLVREARG